MAYWTTSEVDLLKAALPQFAITVATDLQSVRISNSQCEFIVRKKDTFDLAEYRQVYYSIRDIKSTKEVTAKDLTEVAYKIAEAMTRECCDQRIQAFHQKRAASPIFVSCKCGSGALCATQQGSEIVIFCDKCGAEVAHTTISEKEQEDGQPNNQEVVTRV